MFCKESIAFLGYIITPLGVSPNPDKLKSIREFPVPTSKLALQRFSGVCNFYRQFSIKYSNYVTPLRDLLADDTPFNWTAKHTKAFNELKDSFINCVTLNHYIPGTVFKVQTDASDLGLSGILYQIDEKGDHKIISLISRCLAKAELNYTTTEKELLAIMYAMEKFRI